LGSRSLKIESVYGLASAAKKIFLFKSLAIPLLLWIGEVLIIVWLEKSELKLIDSVVSFRVK
jgi:hypothetical protein